VATGIDHVSAKAAPAESRMTELTHKLRSDHQRHAERVERAEHPPAMRPQPQQPMDLDQVAQAAVAAALLPPTAIEDVTIRSIPQEPSLFLEPHSGQQPIQDQPPRAFIPPPAERIPGNRAPRMPRIDELP